MPIPPISTPPIFSPQSGDPYKDALNKDLDDLETLMHKIQSEGSVSDVDIHAVRAIRDRIRQDIANAATNDPTYMTADRQAKFNEAFTAFIGTNTGDRPNGDFGDVTLKKPTFDQAWQIACNDIEWMRTTL
jgi:hypothetical protein